MNADENRYKPIKEKVCRIYLCISDFISVHLRLNTTLKAVNFILRHDFGNGRASN